MAGFLIAALLFLEAPRLLEILPAGRAECAGSSEIPGNGVIVGSDGCLQAGVVPADQAECAGSSYAPANGVIMGSDGCFLAGAPIRDSGLSPAAGEDRSLEFPQQVTDVPPPAQEPVAARGAASVQSESGQAPTAERSSQTAPGSVPSSASFPHHPKAVELSRRLGVPLPDIEPSGTSESDGSVADPSVNQPAGGSGAPTTVVVVGAANGGRLSPGTPAAQQAEPAGPAAPPVGEGQPGITDLGSPGLPPN